MKYTSLLAVMTILVGCVDQSAEKIVPKDVANPSETTSQVVAAETDVSTAVEMSEIRNIRAISPGQFAGGQPTIAQIEFLARNGVKHIVNLRPDTELEFDETKAVTDAGMVYHQLPISGASDVSIENALALRAILEGIDGEATLVHCASGNRVGALMALAAYEVDGASLEESLEVGRTWGMTRLESVVSDVINSKEQSTQE